MRSRCQGIVATIAGLSLLVAMGCQSDDSGRPSATADEVAIDLISRSLQGEHGSAFDLLHLRLRDGTTRGEYVRCEEEQMALNNVVPASGRLPNLWTEESWDGSPDGTRYVEVGVEVGTYKVTIPLGLQLEEGEWRVAMVPEGGMPCLTGEAGS